MMARKRKKEVVEETYDFVPPEFDERKFLENDIRGTKLLLVTVAFSVICGIIGYAVGGVSIYLGLVVLIGGMVALRYLYPLARVPKESVETKTLLGNVVLFFFIFAGYWLKPRDILIPCFLAMLSGGAIWLGSSSLGVPPEFTSIGQGLMYAAVAGIAVSWFTK